MLDFEKHLSSAIQKFNDKMGYSFSPESIVLRTFNGRNYKRVYNEFVSEHSFHKEDPEHLKSTKAEVFPYGKNDVSGILLRENIKASVAEYIMLHELSHIFLTREEIKGGHFYDRFCSDQPRTQMEIIDDGTINAGYAIWREFAAELLASFIMGLSIIGDPELLDVSDRIEQVVVGNPSAKAILASVLCDYAICDKLSGFDWKKHLGKIEMPFPNTLKLVLEQAHRIPFYRITPEFVYSVGQAYLFELFNNSLNPGKAVMGS